MDEFATGLRFFFAGLFLVTGATKAHRRADFELVLVQLFGTRPFLRARLTSRTAAIALAGYELGFGGLLTAGLFMPVLCAILVATLAAFMMVVVRAFRLHVSCGCYPDRRPTEISSVVRSSILLSLACLLTVLDARSALTIPQAVTALGWMAVTATVAFIVPWSTRKFSARRFPDPPKSRLLPRSLAEAVLSSRGMSPHILPGTRQAPVELLALAQTARLPISIVLAELEQIVSPTTPSKPENKPSSM